MIARLFVTALLLLVLLPLSAEETVVKLDKLKSATPAEWKSEKPMNRLRSHQFRVPAAKGSRDAEIAILPDVKGTIEANYTRWKEQFVAPDDKTVDDISKVSKFTVGKAKVDVLDIRGTWIFKERPFDPKSKEELRANSRVIFLIFDTGDENYLIRFAGPAATVDAHHEAFLNWVKAFK